VLTSQNTGPSCGRQYTHLKCCFIIILRKSGLTFILIIITTTADSVRRRLQNCQNKAPQYLVDCCIPVSEIVGSICDWLSAISVRITTPTFNVRLSGLLCCWFDALKLVARSLCFFICSSSSGPTAYAERRGSAPNAPKYVIRWWVYSF